jgi:hypothetical protein
MTAALGPIPEVTATQEPDGRQGFSEVLVVLLDTTTAPSHQKVPSSLIRGDRGYGLPNPASRPSRYDRHPQL